MAEVRARTVYSGQKLTVTAMELLELRTDGSNGRCFVIGSLKPIAVIVTAPDRIYAFGVAAQTDA